MRFWIPFFFLLFSLRTHAEPLKVDVSATSAILINADTGCILYEKDPHLRLANGSTTKIATALYTIERKKGFFEEILTATTDTVGVVHASVRQAPGSKHPSYRLEHDGTHINLKVGEQMSLGDLLYGLMLSSGNDAANVIAQHVSGSVPKFMDELNDFLSSLGLKDTHFNNPHGLYHPEHLTTAADLALLSQIALRNPIFSEIVKTTKFPRPSTNKQQESTFIQGNRLLKPGKYYYPKAIGIKTGYTMKAGRNFVAAARHEGRTLIAVLLKAPSFDNCFQDARTLFDLAFAQPLVTRTLFAKGFDQFTTQVKGGKEPLSAALADDFKIQYFPAEEPSYQAYLHWDELSLPIVKGQAVGELRLITPTGKILKAAPLFATNTLDTTLAMKAKKHLAHPYAKGGFLFLLIGSALALFLYRKTRKTA